MLEIYGVSVRMLRELRSFLDALGKCDVDLERQGRKAATSVVLNLAEASAFRGKRGRVHFEIALGSGKELRAVVDAAMALGYVEGVSARGRDDLERVIATLIRLVR